MAKNTKEHILEVSLILFLQKSFKAVTIQEIVNQSGVSKGAFYHYFESKKELFSEVMNHFYLPLFSKKIANFSHDSLKGYYNDVIENIKEMFYAIEKIEKRLNVDMFGANHYLLVFNAMSLLPSFMELHKKMDREEIDGWINIVKIAREKGEIETSLDDEQLALMFFYLGDGYGVNMISDTHNIRKEKIENEMRRPWDNLYELIRNKSNG